MGILKKKKKIFVNKTGVLVYHIKISLKFAPKGPIANRSTELKVVTTLTNYDLTHQRMNIVSVLLILSDTYN